MNSRFVRRAHIGLRENINRSTYAYILPGIEKKLLRISIICSIFCIVLGCIVLIGWYVNNTYLDAFIPTLPRMRIYTSVLFILSGMSLLLASIRAQSKIVILLRFLAAFVVFLMGGITFFEYISRLNLHLETVFMFNSELIQLITFPRRMAPNSALLFIFLGLSLLLIDKRVKKQWLYQILTLAASFILLPAVLGYIFNIDFIYARQTSTKISLPATLGFMALITGVFCIRPTRGAMRLFTVNSAGGFLARRLFVNAIVIPLVIAWLILLGYKMKFYDEQFRYLLFVTSTIIIFSYSIWRNARGLHQIDLQRRTNDINLRFLSEASKVLASSLDYKKTLSSVAQLSVPHIADWCTVEMLGKKNIVTSLAIAHTDPKKVKWAKEIRKKLFRDVNTERGVSHVIKTGIPELYPDITEDMLKAAAKNKKELQLMRKIGISSVMIIPIQVRKKTIGAIQFISTNSSHKYTQDSLRMAQELASRTALAIENAMLFNNAKSAIKLRNDFISVASHELKTPVTSLKLYMQLLHKKANSQKNNTDKEFIGKMDTQISKLTTLIQDLLDVSRIQSGKLSFKIEPFDLNELIQDLVENIQAITEKHTIVLQGKITQAILGDSERIGQVIVNLLTNAIKYSPGARTIEVLLKEEKGKVTISVKDFGIGIDKNHMNRIFDQFYQIRDKSGRTFAGLGMGLYISREIVRRHGGEIKVESEKGKGSTFFVTLPTVTSSQISTNEIYPDQPTQLLLHSKKQ